MNDQRKASLASTVCIIWLHGLGSDSSDMEGLAAQLSLKGPIRHVFLNAPVRSVSINQNMPMRAWYDLYSNELVNREDKAGILHSETIIHDAISTLNKEGFKSSQILLAGFSQGGAMALFAGLRANFPLAGVMALSCYLPLASECKVALDSRTPIFMAYGTLDAVVLPDWSKKTLDCLHAQGLKAITSHVYAMGHAVCAEEIADASGWLNTLSMAMNLKTGDSSDHY